MRAILVHEFATLDGVIEAPTWTFEFGFDSQMGEAIRELTDRSRAILLGRKTYEMFEPAWSTRTEEDDPGAPFFNDTHKYVVSSTLNEPSWRNSSVLGPYDPEAIRLTLGSGARLFAEDAEPMQLSLEAAEPYANGAVHLAYRRAKA
jgi:RibD C-terminal domain